MARAQSKAITEIASLKEKDRRRVREFIESEVGIQLPPSKHTLIETRLRKRVKELEFTDFRKYLDWVLNEPDGQHERLHLIDAITTNKTFFFREPEHFKFLSESAIPRIQRQGNGRGRHIRVWSAACSSGEEPYTLAITLKEAMSAGVLDRFEILATDISDSCLKKAKSAIYTHDRIEQIPLHLRKKYFLKSRDPRERLVQMAPEVRQHVQFGSFNLVKSKLNASFKMDVIFCRNVMIYFNNTMRQQIVNNFAKHIHSGGYLLIGHSESLNGLNCPDFRQVIPTIYQRI